MCAEMEFRKESMVKMWNQCHVCCRPHLDPNKPRLSLRRNPVGSSGLPGDPLSDLVQFFWFLQVYILFVS